MEPCSRRAFLKHAAALSLLFLCNAPVALGAAKPALYLTHRKEMEEFSGDIHFDQMHIELLGKRREGKVRSYPSSRSSERTDIIIAGGGLAGLMTALLLLESPVVKKRGAVVRLFEMDDDVGGTSKEYEWEGIPYSNSAAYFFLDEKESPLMALYKRIGVLDEASAPGDDDGEAVLIGREMFADLFESGRGVPGREKETAAFRKAVSFFEAMNREDLYPEVPWTAGGAYSQDEFRAIDSLSLGNLLEHGGAVKKGVMDSAIPFLPPLFREYVECFCYSSFGCSMYDVSAWQGMNWLASEFAKGGVGVLPGGNGRISTRLKERISELDSGCIVTARPVVDITHNPSQKLNHVTVADSRDTRATSYTVYTAPHVVMACPLFVSRRILSNELEPKLKSSIDSLSYSAYLVTNVFIDAPLALKYWNVFCLDDYPELGRKGEAFYREKPFIDIVNASWAPGKLMKEGGSPARTVLTLYSPHPFDGQRREILRDTYCRDFRKRVRKDLVRRLEPQGLNDSQIKEIRLARWGHAMLQARPGLCSGGLLSTIRKTGEPKGIHFAGAEMQGAPAVESCFYTARSAVQEISEAFSGRKKAAASASGQMRQEAVELS